MSVGSEMIADFVGSLARAEMLDDRSVNVYEDEVRCANLTRWLEGFDGVAGSSIFIGEAPGRNGARITGVPFVSSYVLSTGGDRWVGYGVPAGENVRQKERSATRFWRHVPSCFEGLPRPLTWNIYPFWPYLVNNRGRLANRTPTPDEIDFGEQWLRRIVEMFPCSRVVALGKNAEARLESMGVEALYVPHPARGSDDDWISALERVAEVLRSDMDKGCQGR